MARGEKFQFVGYYNCLDFVNTEFTKEGGRHFDSLRSFADLIEWLGESRLVNRAQLQRALKLWGGSAGAAERIFLDALALRRALLAMAEKLATRRPVARESLEAINKTIEKRPACVLRARSSGRFEEMTRLDLHEPEQLMVPIAQSASDLLCHGDLALVKRCANPACGAFFYDTSKNHTRRWCSTTGCGNRMRVAAHYRRRRAVS
ncbi:CGNR zinc finger domain-containing protein [Candidatus Binatus sp.]|uniref:CGNR zinc finger domain-containing protein n=1 Tax=Candidatus Binatus sp. TaxID=2811406 RepID=UPI003C4894E6